MIAAWTVAEVRAAEALRLAEVPGGALMQRAAAALATVCAGELRARRSGGRLAGSRVVLLVGSGNNGGDALYAGARLAARGVRVDAVLLGATPHLEGLAALVAAGGRAVPAGAAAQFAPLLAGADLVLDGIVGLGGSPGLREPAATVVAAIPPSAVVVAVDLPSGLDADTGRTPGPHVIADVTVTFGAAKPCLLLPPASRAAGRLVQVELGLRFQGSPAVERLEPADAALLWPVPGPQDDKYRRGVLGVVAGSPRYPGAAVLAVGGALRAGAGMVRYLGPAYPADLVQRRWPEVVVGDGRVQAWLVGPGIDPAEPSDQGDAVRRALDSGLPAVLDAGALASAPGHRPAPTLLTPHAGELARLLGVPREEVESAPLAHARQAAEQTGATVLLKGSTTLVVTPAGRVRSQADAPPWLATAGAGDVLAGIAGTLLAAGLDPLDAGSLAALVHGRAAARACGGGPLLASDVAAALPATIAQLLAGEAGRRPVDR